MSTYKIDVRSRGALFDGTAPEKIQATMRRWLQGYLDYVKRTAQALARERAYDTGRYMRGFRFETRVDRFLGLTGQLYNDDVPGKVNVIERGFPARPLARQPKSGGVRMGKGRKGTYIFQDTSDRTRGLVVPQSSMLGAELVRELGR